MATLDGSDRLVDLGDGVRLQAPGLLGTASQHEPTTNAQRRGGGPQTKPLLSEVLEATKVELDRTIEIRVREFVERPESALLRTERGEDALRLEVPAAGSQFKQMILMMDETGGMSWHFPQSQESGSTRGGQSNTYLIRRRTAPGQGASTNQRFLVELGKWFLQVFVFPITDLIVGGIARNLAHDWESQNRPYGVRWLTPSNYQSPDTSSFSSTDWQKLGEGPALLFLHGTFARAELAFNDLPASAMQTLFSNYGGRVAAFNHFTLSQNPEDNVRWLLSQLSANTRLKLDVVCHSRGGLVARVLAGALALPGLDAIEVRKIVYCGTPNAGTALADPHHMTAMLDRITTLFNLFPFVPNVITGILEAVVTVVKIIGHGVLNSLSGLASMNPTGEFVRRLQTVTPEAYVVTADYNPPEGGLRDLVRDLRNTAMDLVFGSNANDLVVPTDGVGANFTAAEQLRFDTSALVSHFDFFANPAVQNKLLNWLKG